MTIKLVDSRADPIAWPVAAEHTRSSCAAAPPHTNRSSSRPGDPTAQRAHSTLVQLPEVEDEQNSLMSAPGYAGSYTVRAGARGWAAAREKSTRMEDCVSV